jgi:2-polyprenyl-3-methyl-5-hydroxy-6-metoxy-1,4-benzoquinol methylase
VGLEVADLMNTQLEAAVYGCLDVANAGFLQGAVTGDAVTILHSALSNARTSANALQWNNLRGAIRQHPIAKFLYQDPLTRRSFEKPRRYPGDADLIDMIYGSPFVSALLEQASEIGQKIFRHNVATPACTAVRNRRDLIARVLDKMAADRSDLAVLSIACGHMREFTRSEAVKSGKVRRCVGVDHDPQTIEAVAFPGANLSFEPIVASVLDVIQGRKQVSGTFDLVYSTGLFDYLPDAAFVRLVRALWSNCRSGGMLLVANVTRDNPQLGYLESFMDWSFVLRDEAEMMRLIHRALGESVRVRSYRESSGIVAFAEVLKV